MTQTEFAQWLETILGGAPIEELISDEVRAHMDRVYLANEERAWGFAHEDSREAYQVTLRSLCKMMFTVGYDAGREQAQMDNLFGGGSGMFGEDDENPNRDDQNRDDQNRSNPGNLDGALPI